MLNNKAQIPNEYQMTKGQNFLIFEFRILIFI